LWQVAQLTLPVVLKRSSLNSFSPSGSFPGEGIVRGNGDLGQPQGSIRRACPGRKQNDIERLKTIRFMGITSIFIWRILLFHPETGMGKYIILRKITLYLKATSMTRAHP